MASWSPEEKQRCRERCAQVGDPPCFELDLPAEEGPCEPCRTVLPGLDTLEARAARDSFVEGMETRPTDMKRSIHRSHRVEGRNSVG